MLQTFYTNRLEEQVKRVQEKVTITKICHISELNELIDQLLIMKTLNTSTERGYGDVEIVVRIKTNDAEVLRKY